MGKTGITRRQHGQTFARVTTEDHEFQLQPFRGFVLEVEDVHFHHDSAVFLPDYGDTPDPERVSGLSVLAAGYKHAKNNPAHQLLIAGHTDTSGRDDYNVGLSLQRADSVMHVLLGSRDDWVTLSKAKHKVEDYQQILKWAAWTYAWDCDPGAVDNVHGWMTTSAVRNFQRDYNTGFDAAIAVDGVVGSETWGAFFDVYVDHLKQTMKVDDARLATARASLKFLGPKRVGCGENFPIEAPRKNSYRSKINRRVELLYFAPDQLPNLECHPGSACKAVFCEIYNPKMYRYTHLPPVPLPYDPVYDLMNVTSPDHIAPGKEKILIEYDIVNEENEISAGRVEILRRKDQKVLATFELTPEQYQNGHHSDFEWDGSADKSDEFPDGFVTLEHSDYTARVTISGGRGDRSGTTDVKVELKSFKVELGKKDYLKTDDAGKRDREVYDQVGAIPAASLVKLYLRSNLFASADTDMNDQTAYTEYSNLWGGGARIPLVATVTVIDSKGGEVRAGHAMGRARVVWDYADPAQSIDTYKAVPYQPANGTSDSQGAKPFVDLARNYKKDGTKPKDGDNGHVDFGGKRTDNPGPPVFHAGDSGTTGFPFSCDKGSNRTWAGLSKFQKTGEEEAQAGSILRPSRLAGDNYKLAAYLDIQSKLDVTDEKPAGAEREIELGQFEIWRRINMVAHFRKNAQVTGVMPTFAEYYVDAYVDVKDDRGPIRDLNKAFYDTTITAAITSVAGNALLKRYGLQSEVSHWDGQPTATSGSGDPTGWIAAFRDYPGFRAAVMSGEHLTSAELTAVLTNNGLETHYKYVQRTSYYAADLGAVVCKAKIALEGLTILQFDCASSQEPSTWKILNGMAVFFERKRTGFLLTNTDAGTEQTPAHEIGHCMCLPHAPRLRADAAGTITLIDNVEGITPDFHDKKNRNCLMSYNRPRPGFCGLCLLRLRGYKGDKFDQNGPK